MVRYKRLVACPKGEGASFRVHLVIMKGRLSSKASGRPKASIRGEGGQGGPLGGFPRNHAGRAHDGTSAYQSAMETEPLGVS
jgi:hypothetical protein